MGLDVTALNHSLNNANLISNAGGGCYNNNNNNDKPKLHQTGALVPVVAGVLASRVEASAKIQSLSQMTSEFHGSEPPRVSLLEYLRRIEQYAQCSPVCHILAVVYIERLINTSFRFRLTAFNVHRLYISALLVAVKFCEDIYYDNAFFARVGGVSLHEMNRMELALLKALEFRAFVSREVFHEAENTLAMEVLHSQHPSCVEPQLLLVHTGLHTPSHNASTNPWHLLTTPTTAMAAVGGGGGGVIYDEILDSVWRMQPRQQQQPHHHQQQAACGVNMGWGGSRAFAHGCVSSSSALLSQQQVFCASALEQQLSHAARRNEPDHEHKQSTHAPSSLTHTAIPTAQCFRPAVPQPQL